MERLELEHIQNIWDYLNLTNTLVKSDFILVLGSADDTVAIHGGYLYLLKYAKKIITSGGFGKITRQTSSVPEGERFAKIIQSMGVPESDIIVESEASNTGENITFAKKIITNSENSNYKRGILVTKPYMTRRAYATATKQWPETEWQVSSPMLTLEMYFQQGIDINTAINLMVGDLQRIDLYGKNGFQTEQLIPEEVWASYEYLKSKGYDRFVIK